MPLALLPVTLVFTAALAFVNAWLTIRVGQVRRANAVSVGDGGVEAVVRRMRAHANFAENAPLAALLVVAIELSAGTSPWLWGAAAVFVAARLAHGVGMDGWSAGRSGGAVATLAVQLVLAIWAITLVVTHSAPRTSTAVVLPASG